MTYYKLVAKGGRVIVQSSSQSYLKTLQRTNPGSRIVKVSSRILNTVQPTTTTLSKRNRFVASSQRSRTSPRAFKSTPPPAIRGNIRIMPSSWIRDVRYDTLTGELHINMNGKWYGPWYVDEQTYIQFITGKAVPTTTDKRRPPRWARGIGPSLGASFHEYIKIGHGNPLVNTLEQQVIQKYKLLAQIQ